MGPTRWLVTALLGFAVLPALADLASVWWTVPYASHGFLVPLLSAGDAWRRRTSRPRLPDRIEPRGLGLAFAGIVGELLAKAAGSPSGEGIGVVVAATGAAWAFGGGAWVRWLAFPLGFLLFMVPLPSSWLAEVVVRLQLFVTESSIALLHLLGVAAARVGNVIELSTGESLFVKEACSGLTSIVTLTPIAVVLARVHALRLVSAAALLIAVVPVAVATNLLRVVVTVAAADRFGVEAVTRPGPHTVAGVGVFALGCGLLVAAARLGDSRRRDRKRPR